MPATLNRPIPSRKQATKTTTCKGLSYELRSFQDHGKTAYGWENEFGLLLTVNGHDRWFSQRLAVNAVQFAGLTVA